MPLKEDLMRTIQILILITFVTFVAGCATTVPNELVKARSAYQNASNGPAAQLAPAELHKARKALDLAEQSFEKDSDSYKTRDLAYAAQRKAELAGVRGTLAADKANKDQANIDFQNKQTELVKQGRQDLIDSEKQTAQAHAEIDKQTAVAKLRKQALIDSEQRTADALAALAALAAVKEEERGLVVTLSGSVLFRSAQSNLLPSARVKLDQVADALLAVSERNLIVEGHTDSQGSASYNQNLSQRRADTVRDYLVRKGYPSERIRARGMGQDTPIADNASAEGRANNRRVEIVIEREMQKPNQ
jgi:outer membrane protein OmpA-like peptidoglycan-associated protein